jgi:hypothetical protein
MGLRHRQPGRESSLGLWLAPAIMTALALLVAFREVRTDRDAGAPSPPGASPASRPASPAEESIRSTKPPSPRAGNGAAAVPPAGGPRPRSAAGESSVVLSGASYLPDQYRTRRVKDRDDFELWNLDPQELAWLLSNQRQVLTRDLETAPESGGGLRLARIRPGSFAALRGLRTGDILLEINGLELDGPFDVEDLLEDPAYSGARGWRIRLLREGKPLTLDYRVQR